MPGKIMQRRAAGVGKVPDAFGGKSDAAKCRNQACAADHGAMHGGPSAVRNFCRQKSAAFAEQVDLRDTDRPVPKYGSSRAEPIAPTPAGDFADISDDLIGFDFILGDV